MKHLFKSLSVIALGLAALQAEAITISTSEVPIPKAIAPTAP